LALKALVDCVSLVKDPDSAVARRLHPHSEFAIPILEVSDEGEGDVQGARLASAIDTAFEISVIHAGSNIDEEEFSERRSMSEARVDLLSLVEYANHVVRIESDHPERKAVQLGARQFLYLAREVRRLEAQKINAGIHDQLRTDCL